MSLPLTRRIARAALLIAAGATPVLGAAGAAGAAELPQAPDLGAVTALDGAGLGNTIDGASTQSTQAVGETGGRLVGTAVPAAGKTVGKAGAKVAPAAQKTVGQAAGGAGELVGGAAKGGLPIGGLPTQGLPIG
ncbi:ATP-binding protein [Streptomyces sp. AM 4-1-1]|uniref:ATP-binding protein n=1 Tax=unclassified Streptomyces TaxID=2593676 RepID=UPI0023B8C01B|nr:ATP-binding protein [Streptomyces sp. AM 4-1-1]WEH35690.1 ATP-binding protein [Streptomyces sp. AM 4-1-1]